MQLASQRIGDRAALLVQTQCHVPDSFPALRPELAVGLAPP